jgi:SPP1 gp7 family putative phage head morphogenesis protein
MKWSERLWKDRELVGKKVTEILETGLPQGKSMQEMIRDLKNETGVLFRDAFRLIRTESAHVDGEVLLESFKQAQRELGYEYYIYDATIDNRTSDICKDLDNKRFKISEAVIGVNFPPSHPSCRSTCVLDESSINENLIED